MKNIWGGARDGDREREITNKKILENLKIN
jgi:hypothetical protein